MNQGMSRVGWFDSSTVVNDVKMSDLKIVSYTASSVFPSQREITRLVVEWKREIYVSGLPGYLAVCSSFVLSLSLPPSLFPSLTAY